MSDSTTTLIESRLDWLTVTCQSEAMRPVFRSWASRLLAEEVARGNELQPFSLRGYRGNHAGRIAYGEEPNSALAQLQGTLSEERFSEAMGLADRVTRIDPSITVRQTPFDAQLARSLYVAAVREWERPGFPPTYSLIDSSNRGSTLYVGRRTSDRFGRFYDKYAESGDAYFRDCWRLEVECKGSTAGRVAAHCVGAADRGAFCAGYVCEYFRSRNVQPPIDSNPVIVSGSDWAGIPDWHRHSKWLRNSVAPVVRRAVSAGRGDELLTIFGLVGTIANPPDPESGSHPHPTL